MVHFGCFLRDSNKLLIKCFVLIANEFSEFFFAFTLIISKRQNSLSFFLANISAHGFAPTQMSTRQWGSPSTKSAQWLTTCHHQTIEFKTPQKRWLFFNNNHKNNRCNSNDGCVHAGDTTNPPTKCSMPSTLQCSISGTVHTSNCIHSFLLIWSFLLSKNFFSKKHLK